MRFKNLKRKRVKIIKIKLQLFLLDNLIWVMIIFLFIFNAIVVPKFFTYNNVLNIFFHISSVGLLILAEGIVLLVGKIDLSVEAILAFAPGITIVISNRLFPEINPIIQIAITLLVGIFIGLTNGLFISRFKMNPLLETLAANTVIRGFVLLIIPFSIINLNPVYTFVGNARTFGNIPIAVLTMLFSYLILSFIMNKTRFGRFLIATGGNPNASYIAGINVNNIIISAYALSGFFCALAGLLAAGRQSTISNVMGQGLVMEAIAGAILGGVALEGGRGTVWGMFGGALILGLFNNFLTLLAINVYWVTIIKGSLILFAIMLDSLKKRAREVLLYREKLETLGTIILPIKENKKS